MTEGYSTAVTEGEFERMKNDPRLRVTDFTGMGPMSEFDVFVSWDFAGTEHNEEAE